VDRIIQIATNAVPLQAVFGDGSVTPVVGLALVRGELEGMRVNLPGGIAIFNDGLVVCEQVECFCGYAEPAKFDRDGNVIEDEAKVIYGNWIKQQQAADSSSDGAEEE